MKTTTGELVFKIKAQRWSDDCKRLAHLIVGCLEQHNPDTSIAVAITGQTDATYRSIEMGLHELEYVTLDACDLVRIMQVSGPGTSLGPLAADATL